MPYHGLSCSARLPDAQHGALLVLQKRGPLDHHKPAEQPPTLSHVEAGHKAVLMRRWGAVVALLSLRGRGGR